MTGQARLSPICSTSETSCTSRRPTLVLIQSKDDCSSTAVLPLCRLTQHQSPDTTSLKTMGKRDAENTVREQQTGCCAWANVCLLSGAWLMQKMEGLPLSSNPERGTTRFSCGLKHSCFTMIRGTQWATHNKHDLKCLKCYDNISVVIFVFRYLSLAIWKLLLKCRGAAPSTRPAIMYSQGDLFFFCGSFLVYHTKACTA